MNTNFTSKNVKLGIFVLGGLIIFGAAIFILGKQKNLFNPIFKLTTTFSNVSGLQVGATIRFAGIAVGTVDNIKILNDSLVQVTMIVKKDVQKFIKADCEASIGSSGIIGDRILIISQGSDNLAMVEHNQFIKSNEPIETDAILASIKTTADNAALISIQATEIFKNLNSGNGTLGRLITDSTMAENINKTIVSLKASSKSLDENMNAAKDNILLRGYFNKKEKIAQKKKDTAQNKIEESKTDSQSIK